MDKRTIHKEFKSPSILNGKKTNSKYSKTNNITKPKIGQRKNKSELKFLKLQPTFEK